jgi:transposase
VTSNPGWSYDRLLEESSSLAGPCKNTCRTYVDKYWRGDILDEPEARGGVTHEKLDFAMCMLLIWFCKMRPDMFLHEYCERFMALVGLSVSESAVCRALKKLRLTLKKARIRRVNKYLAANVAYHQSYLVGLLNVDHRRLCFFDETAVSSREEACRRLHRSFEGTSAEATLPSNQNYRLSVNGLTSATNQATPLTWDICAVSFRFQVYSLL